MSGEQKSWVVTVQPGGWSFPINPGESLLEAALAAGVELPHSCRNGTCRACRCQMLRGQVSYRVAWPGLSLDEKEAGETLPCVALACTDVVLDVPTARMTASLFDDVAPAQVPTMPSSSR